MGQAGNRTAPDRRQRGQGSGGTGKAQKVARKREGLSVASPPDEASSIKTVNLKSDRPSVHEALQRMEREIALARRQQHSLVKLVHGYGSSGAGGDIRIAVQRRLRELAEDGRIAGCIFGEDWGKSDETTWRLLQAQPELKDDADLGRRNRGITIVLL